MTKRKRKEISKIIKLWGYADSEKGKVIFSFN